MLRNTVSIFLEQSSLRCGFVALLGQANAGKSTLLNALMAYKLAAVSSKEHTTRHDIYGIWCRDEAQIIFVDTPGLIRCAQGPLQTFMRKNTSRGMREADIATVVIDANVPVMPSTFQLLDKLCDKPLVIVLNKIDSISKERLLPLAQKFQKWTPYIVMISALHKEGLDYLTDTLRRLIPEGPWLFDGQDLTQISQRFWAAELTREKIFQYVHQEIPYHVCVETDEWKEKTKEVTIRQSILVDDIRYRKWIIGHEGQRIRHIGQQARMDMMQSLEKTVHLFLHVRVDASWAKSIEHKTI